MTLTAPPSWDPLESADAVAAACLNGPGSSPPADIRISRMARYARIAGYIVLAVFILPQILSAVLAMALGAGLPAAGHILLTVAVLGGFYLAGVRGLKRFRQATAPRTSAPTMRRPVRAAAKALHLVPAAPVSPARLIMLRKMLGDVYQAIALPDADAADLTETAPDAFRGVLPDGAGLWCLVKQNVILREGIPEDRRGGVADGEATALTMLLAFPLTHGAGVRLEILHRVMQVMFVRVARTIDTGSAAFNNRFFVAPRGPVDALAVHQAVTPALQAALLDFSQRFWLVNVIVEDKTVFVSAMDFQSVADDPAAARWVEATLSAAIAGAAHLKTYIE